jgi:hypothetical protein
LLDEEEIGRFNEELEQPAIERTAPLQTANKRLESEIAERKGAEEASERHVAELSALNAMATIVTESLDVDEILNRAMDEALRLAGVEAAAMLLLDEEAGELVMAIHRGLSDEFVQAFSRIKLGEGLAGTEVGTLCVKLQLRTSRFTPATTRVINLIQTDVGQPVGHIVSNLVDCDRLVADV